MTRRKGGASDVGEGNGGGAGGSKGVGSSGPGGPPLQLFRVVRGPRRSRGMRHRGLEMRIALLVVVTVVVLRMVGSQSAAAGRRQLAVGRSRGVSPASRRGQYEKLRKGGTPEPR